MRKPPAAHLMATLAALSRQSHFSIGCYCEDETLCHRSLLREMLIEAGAEFVTPTSSSGRSAAELP